jgi:hypothetical protein
MNAITFQTFLRGEPLIHLPPGVELPEGEVEVMIRPSRAPASLETIAAASANLWACRVDIGRATGTDNTGIDADLEQSYGESLG